MGSGRIVGILIAIVASVGALAVAVPACPGAAAPAPSPASRNPGEASASPFTVLVPPGLSFVPGAIHGAVSPRGAEASLHATRDRLSVTPGSPVRSLSVSIGAAGLAGNGVVGRAVILNAVGHRHRS